MLWNWNTIDACFIARSWRITSKAKFAGSCIGVVLLVIVLEMLRRTVKEYDRYLIKKHAESVAAVKASPSPKSGSDDGTNSPQCPAVVNKGYRPNVFEQAIRALLHMLQFAVAYFIMLCVLSLSLLGCLGVTDFGDDADSPCITMGTSLFASSLALISAASFSIGKHWAGKRSHIHLPSREACTCKLTL